MMQIPLSEVVERVQQAVRQWGNPDKNPPLAPFLFYRERQADAQAPLQDQVLEEAVRQLGETNAELAQVLRLRFQNKLSIHEVAQRLSAAEATVHRWRTEAIRQLAEILAAQEAAARAQRITRFAWRLEPPTYDRLFGVTPALAKLEEWLADEAALPVLAIEGIGGIGKSSLADALLRRAIATSRFDDFAWVSVCDRLFLDGEIRPATGVGPTTAAVVEALAGQLLGAETTPAFAYERTLQALHFKLTQRPALIAIDNLETLADPEALLVVLRRLAGPTRFVLTTRTRLPRAGGVCPFPAPELAEHDALALVRDCAARHALADVAGLEDDALRPIFTVVGGNPLALRLVAGQLHERSLADVLAALRSARGRPVEQLYTFIYQRAWDRLDDSARTALLAMPLAPPTGVTAAEWGQMSGLAPSLLHDAIGRLVKLNLVNHLRIDLNQSRYTVHPLTQTFLLEQVLQWQ